MLLNRETYVQMLTKLAAAPDKDDPHKIDSSAVSQSEHLDNKKDVKSDLHELFDEAKRVGKVDTALLKKTLPRGDRETSNPLVKVAEAFFNLIPRTLFLKEASPAYHAAMERGFRAELEKIAKIVGQSRASYAGAQARPVQQMGRAHMDPEQTAQFHEMMQGVPAAAGPGPVGLSPAGETARSAAMPHPEPLAATKSRLAASLPPAPKVDTAALARIHGTGSAARVAETAAKPSWLARAGQGLQKLVQPAKKLIPAAV
jgi:hypothetical protein